MAKSSDSSQEENAFVIDESSMEMAWLLNQNLVLTKGMGGLFPEEFDLSQASSMLDIACGPGGWVLEVAREYPHIEVTGFDVSKQMIDYARAHAKARGLENAHFEVMDALKPLDFPTASFDMVNARTIVGFMNPDAWPLLIQEMMRVCRPQGVICLTEFELPMTNSLAFEQISEMVVHAFQLAQRNFFAHTKYFGTTTMLGRLLRDGGCQDIKKRAYAIDFSAQTAEHESVYQDYQIVYHLIQPFLIKMGVTTSEDIQWIYQNMLAEMLSADFSGIWYYLSVWGKRP
ncbi:MAG: class I SAM-dependent methyltransferase [Ktedonobacteraceae bacterium]